MKKILLIISLITITSCTPEVIQYSNKKEPTHNVIIVNEFNVYNKPYDYGANKLK